MSKPASTAVDGLETAAPLSSRLGLTPRSAVLLIGMAAALLASELAETAVATALPSLVADLADPRLLALVTTGYLVASTVVVPAYGWASDRVGRRRLFLVAAGLFLVGSVFGATAAGPAALVAARVLQGCGGGGFLVLVQAEVAALVPLRRRPTLMSGIGAVFATAVVVGPPLGGWLSSGPGWRWTFWSVVPPVLVALVVVAAFMPAPAASGRGHQPAPAIRAPGSWTLLGTRQVRLAAGGAMLVGAASFGTLVYLPTFLQLVMGLSPVRAGLTMLPLFGGLGGLSVAAARVVRRGGSVRNVLVVGAVTVGAGLTLLGLGWTVPPLLVVVSAMVLLGAGTGCVWELVVVVVQAGAPDDRLGTATGTGNLLREIGVVAGTAAVGAWLSRIAPADPQTMQHAYGQAFRQVFWVLTPLALVAAGLFARLRPWADA